MGPTVHNEDGEKGLKKGYLFQRSVILEDSQTLFHLLLILLQKASLLLNNMTEIWRCNLKKSRQSIQIFHRSKLARLINFTPHIL